MTANAMKHDLEACLAAGMNDYVTKPIDRRLLAEALRRWLPTKARVEPSPGEHVEREEPAEAVPALPGIDVAGALRRLGLPWESLRAMLLRFAEGERRTLELLRAAVASADGPAAARYAHTLAGAAGNLGADHLREATKALEKAGREGAELSDLLRVVEEKAAVVFSSIDSLHAEPKRPAPVPTASAVDPERLRGALTRLRTALEDSDPGSSSAVLDELTNIGAGEDLERVRTLAEGYQYDEAAEIVARLLEEMENV
jgi:two-component system sensor histidine kinase/response regulator